MRNRLIMGDEEFEARTAAWVMRLAGVSSALLHPGEFHAIVVAQGARPVAGVIYHNYCRMGTGGRVEMSGAAVDPSWIDRGTIRGLLHYPFFQLDCHVVIFNTSESNASALRFLRGLGCAELGRLANRPYCEDTLTFSLRRDDAVSRWHIPSLREAA